LEYDTLKKINPRIIYVDFSSYGLKGPLSNKPAYDRLVQAYSGVHGRRTLPDGTPLSAGVWIGDSATPLLIVYGVALALLAREKTGRGQKVETSLLAGAVAMQSMELVRAEGEEKSPPKSLADQAVYAPYRCADGRYIIPIIVKDDEWKRYCRALEIENLEHDPRFSTSQTRAENSGLLFSILEGIISTKSRDEWLKIFEDHDIPSAPILLPQEVFDHPQMLQNQLIIEVTDPRIGKISMTGYPVKLSEAPPSVRRIAPALGEHTDEILKEIAYSDEEIKTLRMKQIVT
jgi:crotonobetainyl-CoA:carnitine CoA-transferase CaiB-like acyl-CoA transferase